MTAHALEIDGVRLEAPAAATLFDCAEAAGVRVPTSCRKQGKCRECLLEVTDGMDCLSPRAPEEEHLAEGFRLACRTRFRREGLVRCRTLRRGEMQIELEPEGLDGAPPSLAPAVERRGDGIYLDGELLEQGSGPLFGVAVDLGTTTVVVRLVDLESGAVAAASAFENPQRFGGSDVMARISYDSEHGGRLLQRVLLGYLAHAMEGLPAPPEAIYEIVIAGNTTMRDLFFGLSVESIGQRPYRSLTEAEWLEGKRAGTSLTAPARRLGLPTHRAARVYGLPLISGHVGADAAACILATDLLHEERLVAIMDIGTNTEILLGNRERLFVASCPAGPAFEGGLIPCGMPALAGAIEAVAMDAGGQLHCQVIGGAGRPQGICGSGLIDLLSELRRTGRMDALGRFAEGLSCVTLGRESSLSLSELDVSRLAQAKAANIAGLAVLLGAAGVDLGDIDVLYLAGGFAKRLRLEAARRIGFIPDMPLAKLRQVGNAAILGATQALLSVESRRELEAFVKRAVHVELETAPEFFDRFVDGCHFQPLCGPAGDPCSHP